MSVHIIHLLLSYISGVRTAAYLTICSNFFFLVLSCFRFRCTKRRHNNCVCW